MAQVTGMTAEKILDLTSDSLVSAAIDQDTGVLTLTTRGGQAISAGNVATKRSVDKAYPVGSVFISTLATSPATSLGVGTWQSFGTGRVLVGVDASQTEFDVAEKTGGAKTHTLSVNELPSHNHGGASGGQSTDHSHTGYTSIDGNHTHGYVAQATAPQTAPGANNYYTGRIGTQTDPSGSHQHSVQTYGASTDHTHSITAQGGGAAHNNLQPYITCYMWKRTA